MRLVAGLGTAWVAWRWIGFFVGLVRLRRLEGPVRREARRMVVARGAVNTALSIGVVYLWAFALQIQPGETFVGFLAAMVIVALAIGAAARLMLPSVVLPYAATICRVVGGMPDTPVRPIGVVLRTDENGAYITAKKSVAPPWDAAVADYVRAVVDHLGDRVHSIYVRGSLAKGTSIEGVSDIDGVVVTHDEVDLGKWPGSLQRTITARYPFVAGIEVLPLPLAGVLAEEGRNRFAFLLATQGIYLYGTDLIDSLPRFGFGPWAFVHSRGLDQAIDRYLDRAPREEDPDERRDWCVWIMRAVVRTAFESVMAEEGTYTRDLFPCYEAFRRHHPDEADGVWRALELAVDPSDDVTKVTAVLEGPGRRIAALGKEAHEAAAAALERT